MNDPKYQALVAVLQRAYEQCAEQKGRERHANERRFEDQPILAITRSKGLGFPAGQADKKITEALGMVTRGNRDAAVKECLGAIIYIAGLIVAIEEDMDYEQSMEPQRPEGV